MHTFLAIFFKCYIILYIIRTIRNHDYQIFTLYPAVSSYVQERQKEKISQQKSFDLSKLIAADIKWASKLITSNDPSGLIPKKEKN